MGQYRKSRNFEASIIDFLTDKFLEARWGNISIEKSFERVYGLSMDQQTGAAVICIRLTDTKLNKVEVGTESLWRTALVMIDIFATSDGQRLDLKDFIVDAIKGGMPYYEYTVTGKAISAKTQNGRIRVINIIDTPVNLNTDRSALDVHDRYRHSLSLDVSTSQVES